MAESDTTPESASTSTVAPRPGKRSPTTGKAQADRIEWGNRWGGIVSELAAGKRASEA